MGRFAQSRKRGSSLAEEPGLPPGPTAEQWILHVDSITAEARWNTDGGTPYDYWISRWRVPAVSMLWTLSEDEVQEVVLTALQNSPFEPVVGQQQQAEVAYTDAEGNVLTQWSAFKFGTP